MYSQTYVVKEGEEATREAYFQCGEHCYSGEIKLDLRYAFERITLKDIPSLVPIVQRQQDELSYLCNASNIPVSSTFHGPLEELEWARNFVVSEITSESVSKQMAKLKEKHAWLDNDESRVYFELIGETPAVFHDILFIASRVYANGLRIDTLYFEGVVYVTLEDGTGEQPLLDIQQPDISGSGKGATLAIYENDGRGRNGPWMKLSVWQVPAKNQEGIDRQPEIQPDEIQPMPKDLSSDCYVQSYCILKSDDGNTDMRKTLFRFGSWCYAGVVELVPKISLADIPYVVPALRLQQKKMDFVSDVSNLPSSSPFALAMEYAAKIQPIMEGGAVGSEAYLQNLIAITDGLHWLEDDSSQTFYEFTCFNDESSLAALDNVELLATKSYNANGVVTMSLYFGGSWYLALEDGTSNGDDLPLLDTKFPDLSKKGHSHSIRSYPAGISCWPQLRKMSICCIEGEQDEPPLDTDDGKRSDSTAAPCNDDQPIENDAGPAVEKSGTSDATRKEANEANNPHELEERNQSCASDRDHQETEQQQSSNKLEAKLTRIADEGVGEVAWDTDGKPAYQAGAEEEEALAPIPEDSDVYAQLDWLDQRLDQEIRGLNGLLK